MRTSIARRVLVTIILATTALFSASAQQSVETPAALSNRISELKNSGKYTEAMPLAEQLAALSKSRSGEDSIEHAEALHTLADLYFFQSRYAEAEPIYQRVIAIRERLLGPTHPDVLSTLDTLASIYRFSHRLQEAEQLLTRVLEAQERATGADSPELVEPLSQLAQIQTALKRFAEAEALLRRALALAEKGTEDPAQMASLLGSLAQVEQARGELENAAATMQRALQLHEAASRSGDTDVNAGMKHVFALMQLGALYQQMERYADAGTVMESVLAMTEKLLGPDHPAVANALEATASTYALVGRFADAEPLRKRALVINERSFGRDHRNVAFSLQGLGHLYRMQDRNEEALPLLLRALSISEKALGPDHPELAPYLIEIGNLYDSQKRYEQAEPLLKRALAYLEKAKDLDPNVAGAQTVSILQSLAFLNQSQGRHAEGRAFAERAVAVSERVFGRDHSLTGAMLHSLALNAVDQGRFDEAERLFTRALPISIKEGKDSTSYADNIAGFSMVKVHREDWAGAYDNMKTASAIYIAADERAAGGAKAGRSASKSGSIRHADIFQLQSVAAYRVAETDPASADRLRGEAFQMTQRAESSQAAAALSQMAARFASGKGALSVLVRERQDLVAEWQSVDARLTTALSATPDQRNANNEQALRERLSGITGRLDAIDARLVKEFPDYAAFAKPQPLTIAEVQRLLAPHEALVLIANRPHQSLVWVIAKDAARWTLVDLGWEELKREVAALRCGLDTSGWEAGTTPTCESLTGVRYRAGEPLPFDLARAHNLYRALLAPFEEIIEGKQLLIAASGPLSSLPFQVLVTEPPNASPAADPSDYIHAAWISKRHAITNLPSVDSLKSLRSAAKASVARHPFLGFGNPLLIGRDGQDRSAWTKQNCPRGDQVALAQLGDWRRPEPLSVARLFRGGRADTEMLRRQDPLPETADELCAVAHALNAPDSDVMLGEKASEKTIAALNASNALATYKVVHFATHGLLAGEAQSLGLGVEPALLLTPPQKATAAEDGLLTASEVAQLKLDADWVVLSACNTAGGESGSSEALSGLARAFFYAGARALLVSHWYVDSDAAVKLVTRAFAEMATDPTIGRAEAFRRAMLAFMSTTDRPKHWTSAAHPAVWAPFVVVGEGGAIR
jgi:CHAT domain-containing protein/tetratricopeptide (TPR) repeat protein